MKSTLHQRGRSSTSSPGTGGAPSARRGLETMVEREILRPLWKVHILHHASEHAIVGNWMLEELREHGYRVSPGTLYPLLGRMVRLGWLGRTQDGRYRLTAAGRRVLAEVRKRLRELQREVFSERKT